MYETVVSDLSIADVKSLSPQSNVLPDPSLLLKLCKRIPKLISVPHIMSSVDTIRAARNEWAHFESIRIEMVIKVLSEIDLLLEHFGSPQRVVAGFLANMKGSEDARRDRIERTELQKRLARLRGASRWSEDVQRTLSLSRDDVVVFKARLAAVSRRCDGGVTEDNDRASQKASDDLSESITICARAIEQLSGTVISLQECLVEARLDELDAVALPDTATNAECRERIAVLETNTDLKRTNIETLISLLKKANTACIDALKETEDNVGRLSALLEQANSRRIERRMALKRIVFRVAKVVAIATVCAVLLGAVLWVWFWYQNLAYNKWKAQVLSSRIAKEFLDDNEKRQILSTDRSRWAQNKRLVCDLVKKHKHSIVMKTLEGKKTLGFSMAGSTSKLTLELDEDAKQRLQQYPEVDLAIFSVGDVGRSKLVDVTGYPFVNGRAEVPRDRFCEGFQFLFTASIPYPSETPTLCQQWLLGPLLPGGNGYPTCDRWVARKVYNLTVSVPDDIDSQTCMTPEQLRLVE